MKKKALIIVLVSLSKKKIMLPIFPFVTIDQKTNTTSIKAHTLHNFKKMSLPDWNRSCNRYIYVKTKISTFFFKTDAYMYLE